MEFNTETEESNSEKEYGMRENIEMRIGDSECIELRKAGS